MISNGVRKKKIGVLFTSGLDSTYLVYKNLEEGNDVHLLYIKVENNRVKTDAELRQVEILCDLFRQKYGYGRVQNDGQIAVVGGDSDYSVALVQSIMWVFGIQFVQRRNYDALQIAYVSNDDAISYIDEIKALYNAYGNLIAPDVTLAEQRMIPLEFPLIKYSKYSILTALPEIYRPHVFSCENPDYDIVDENDQLVQAEIGELKSSTVISKESIETLSSHPIRNKKYKPCGYCHTCRRYESIARDGRHRLHGYDLLLNRHNRDNRQFSKSLSALPSIEDTEEMMMEINDSKETKITPNGYHLSLNEHDDKQLISLKINPDIPMTQTWCKNNDIKYMISSASKEFASGPGVV